MSLQSSWTWPRSCPTGLRLTTPLSAKWSARGEVYLGVNSWAVRRHPGRYNADFDCLELEAARGTPPGVRRSAAVAASPFPEASSAGSPPSPRASSTKTTWTTSVAAAAPGRPGHSERSFDPDRGTTPLQRPGKGMLLRGRYLPLCRPFGADVPAQPRPPGAARSLGKITYTLGPVLSPLPALPGIKSSRDKKLAAQDISDLTAVQDPFAGEASTGPLSRRLPFSLSAFPYESPGITWVPSLS